MQTFTLKSTCCLPRDQQQFISQPDFIVTGVCCNCYRGIVVVVTTPGAKKELRNYSVKCAEGQFQSFGPWTKYRFAV